KSTALPTELTTHFFVAFGLFDIPWQRRHILLISDLSATKISMQITQLLMIRTTRPEIMRLLVVCYALHRVQTFLCLFSAISTRVFTDNLLVYGFRFCGVTFVLHDDADFKHRISSLW